MSAQQLHQGLIEDGLYTKSFQEFQNQFQTKEKQLELYNGIVEDGDFTGSFIEFQNKFFPTQAATITPTPTTTTTSTKTRIPKISPKAPSKDNLNYEDVLGENWEEEIEKGKNNFIEKMKYYHMDGTLKTPLEILEYKEKQPGYIPPVDLELIVKINKAKKGEEVTEEAEKITSQIEKEEGEVFELEKELLDLDEENEDHKPRIKEIKDRLAEIEGEKKDVDKRYEEEKTKFIRELLSILYSTPTSLFGLLLLFISNNFMT